MGNMTTLQILQGIKTWVTTKLNLKQDVINDLANIRSGAQAGSTAVQPAELSAYFNDASYDNNTHRINFYHGQTVVAYVDASPFIIDGMVDDVRIENGYLVIDFNTASGKQDISIPLTDIFNPNNYYNKTQTDGLLSQKQDVIQDLADIRSGASAGSTAVQPSTLNNAVKNVVAESGVYDVSANNDNTKFESLSALLSSANLNTLIPTDIRKGGMSIKFVLSSDNKYVQYILMSDSWTINPNFWERYNDVTTSNQQGSDLDFSDERGNVLIRASEGHIKTKNFDSKTVKEKLDTVEEGAEVNDVTTSNQQGSDLDFSDEQGNVLVRFQDGHIKTKNFDSENMELDDYAKKKTIRYLAIGNSVNQDPACYIPYLLRKLYGDDVDFEIGVAYHGSYTIKDYVELMITGQENLETFSYAKNTGHLTNITNVPLSYAVGYADWDIVSFEEYQTDMAGSGRDEDVTLAPDLLNWLKQHTQDGCRFGLITPATYTDVRDLYVGWQQDILTSCSLDFLLDYGATKEFLISKGFTISDLSPLENGRYIHSKEGFPCEALALTAIHFLADIAKIDDKASNILAQITEIEHNALNIPQQNGTYTSTTEEGWRKCVDSALNGWRVSLASYAISNNTLRDNIFTNI